MEKNIYVCIAQFRFSSRGVEFLLLSLSWTFLVCVGVEMSQPPLVTSRLGCLRSGLSATAELGRAAKEPLERRGTGRGHLSELRTGIQVESS